MSDKSELEYLLEALEAQDYSDVTYGTIRRAIERRKQDLAKEVMQDAGKSNPTGNAQPGAAHPVDNTPKGGGDDPNGQAGYYIDLLHEVEAERDALLAERDAARAELKEAVKLLPQFDADDCEFPKYPRPCDCHPCRVRAFLDRVGKQP